LCPLHTIQISDFRIAVFASLGHAERYSLIDFELFLPEEWAKDSKRCDKAKIPKEKRRYKAKWELALELVARACENKVRFGWVGVDSLYGHNNKFLNTLEDRGEKFVADVRKDYKIWTCEPAVEIPVKAVSQRGKTPTRLKLNKEKNKARLVKVSDFVEENFEEQHQTLSYRQGTKGRLCVWVKDVWVWEGRWKGGPRKRRLIARQDESGDFKYSLTNLPDPKDWQRDPYVQGQRFWIEHSFHEAKSQTGMAQYQVRVWQGWHHHMALACLATLFIEMQLISGPLFG
jgi:SRSO17 transposase